MAKKQSEESPSSIDGVPTVAGLAKMGRHLAYISPDGKYHVAAEGHAEIGKALKANAEWNIACGMGDWVQPPSSGKERSG